MISEKRLQPVRTIGFFCTVIVLKIFNLSHLLLDLAPSVDRRCVAKKPQRRFNVTTSLTLLSTGMLMRVRQLDDRRSTEGDAKRRRAGINGSYRFLIINFCTYLELLFCSCSTHRAQGKPGRHPGEGPPSRGTSLRARSKSSQILSLPHPKWATSCKGRSRGDKMRTGLLARAREDRLGAPTASERTDQTRDLSDTNLLRPIMLI